MTTAEMRHEMRPYWRMVREDLNILDNIMK